eukprot:TRINITY_DN2018_c0_g1_i3.p1 TRINITY_DN2018_c0_g1~~TRINITY_DN2018_c0_g1_i3.p1  ORF type:complete len:230 (+),score=21.06 TRINITY_DN2018_c0_g1_i3:76-765(+)
MEAPDLSVTNSLRDSSNTPISDQDLITLVSFYAQNEGLPGSCREDPTLLRIGRKVRYLFSQDFDENEMTILGNPDGVLCESYPPSIVLIDNKSSDKARGMMNQRQEIDELLRNGAKLARARNRFVVPVIWLSFQKNNHSFRTKICRSAGLAETSEVRVKQKSLFIFKGSMDKELTRIRSLDLNLIQKHEIGFIIDLMNQDIFQKAGFALCSSESAIPWCRSDKTVAHWS